METSHTLKFKEEYLKLNLSQRSAVDRLEGPVMVIAGPGTGKTKILGSRIGKILLDTDTPPENIICLTYTDAGVVAMRQKLNDLIGLTAQRIGLYTFHALCNEIIQQNPDHFLQSDSEPVSELESVEIIKEMLDDLTPGNVLKKLKGDVYYDISNLRGLFAAIKKEGWTKEYLFDKIKIYLEDLPTRDEYIYKRNGNGFRKGDLKQGDFEAQKVKMDKLKAGIELFELYNFKMAERNRYDFDDMINWVITAFKKDSFLLQQYQEKYHYMLVDEYQDTSGSQYQLIRQLMSFWDIPNLFVVGDDDQSIYRFQGANIENMMLLEEEFKANLFKVVLTENYRSTQAVLDLSKVIIEQNVQRLVNTIPGLSKNLISSNGKYAGKEPVLPSITVYGNVHQELVGTAEAVDKLLKNGVAPGRIAVIYRENRTGETLAGYFNIKKIPYYTKGRENLLQLPFFEKIFTVLGYLSSEFTKPFTSDLLLFKLLHFDWFGIPPIEIAKINLEVAAQQYSHPITLRQKLSDKISLVSLVDEASSLHPALSKTAMILEGLIGNITNMSLQCFVAEVIEKTGIFGYLFRRDDKIYLLQTLNAFFDMVKEETRRKPLMQLPELVETIQLMRSQGISYPVLNFKGNEKGVNLLTAHGSKGLEFEHVFILDCRKDAWESKRRPNPGFSFPDTLYVQSEKDEKKDLEELRRLFYVALTRSEVYLTLSYATMNDKAKAAEPSGFIIEIEAEKEKPLVRKTFVELPEETIQEYRMLANIALNQPVIPSPEEEFVGKLLENFTLNVTALNNFLDCPLKFYYVNLIKVPSAKNEAMAFGSAIHFALEKYFKYVQANNGQFPDTEEFLGYFKYYMERNRESFTNQQYNNRMTYGNETLPIYAAFARQEEHLDSLFLEKSITSVYEGIPIKGKLDKVAFFSGGRVNIIDYKTGNPENAKDKLFPPKEENQGGDYWRQAVFYKLLVETSQPFQWKLDNVFFDFVEPDQNGNILRKKVILDGTQMEQGIRQIKEVWSAIQGRDFFKGCGKKECEWCNLVKSRE